MGKSEKVGAKNGGLYDLDDLLIFLTIPPYRVGNSTSNWGRISRTTVDLATLVKNLTTKI